MTAPFEVLQVELADRDVAPAQPDHQRAQALRSDRPVEGKREDLAPEVADTLPRERPDSVELLFDQQTKFLRRMAQKQGEQSLLVVEVRELELNPEIDKSLFRLSPPEGVKFVDVMSDPLASMRIKLDLKRLEEHEKRAKEAKGKEGEPPAKDGK